MGTVAERYRMADYCCFDNHIFDINGSGPTMLEKVLEVALNQQGQNIKFLSFKKHRTKGIILYWVRACKLGASGVTDFLSPPTSSELARQLCELIGKADEWFDMKSLKGFEASADHDGHNSMGWRAYCEDWGHVDGAWSTIIAVKPCFMWHGK